MKLHYTFEWSSTFDEALVTDLDFETAVKDVTEFKDNIKGDSNHIHAFRSDLPWQQRPNKRPKPSSANPKDNSDCLSSKNRTIDGPNADTGIILVIIEGKMVIFLLLVKASP